MSLDTDLLQSFWSFVAERHRIYVRRHVQQLPPPWTVDEVLQGAHFTNVYRDLDPGTQLALDRLHLAPSAHDAVYFVVAYRFVNRRETVETFGPVGPYTAHHHAYLAHLDARRAAGHSIYTKRHLTSHHKLLMRALEYVTTGFELPAASPDVWSALQAVPGVGTFLGWQIYADLASSGWLPSYDPHFVRVGDGAAFALAVLEGRTTWESYYHDGKRRESNPRKLDHGRIRPGAVEQVRLGRVLIDELLLKQRSYLPAEHFQSAPELTAWDIEHALCEWFKYALIWSGLRDPQRGRNMRREETHAS